MSHPTGDALGHSERTTDQVRLLGQLDQLRVCLDGLRSDATRASVGQTDQRCLLVGILMTESVVSEIEADLGKREGQ